MRFARACLSHALEGHYRTYWDFAVFITAEPHVADEIRRL
jgi:hypothetical protein